MAPPTNREWSLDRMANRRGLLLVEIQPRLSGDILLNKTTLPAHPVAAVANRRYAVQVPHVRLSGAQETLACWISRAWYRTTRTPPPANLVLQLFEISVEIFVRSYRQKFDALLIQHTVRQ